MPSPRGLEVERRQVPGRGYDLSAISFDLAAVPVTSEFSRRTAIAAIRRARAAGVTTFDLTNAVNPPLLESLLAESFPARDPEVVTILGWPALAENPMARSDSRPGSRVEDGLASFTESVRESRTRLGENRKVIVEWRLGAAARPTPEVLSVLARSRSDGLVLDYALRCRPGEPRLDVPPAAHGGLESVELSLLRTEALGAPAPSAARGSTGWIARDVFSGGLLDGSSSLGLGLGPDFRAGPQRFRDLRARLEPVLALGFLTARGDRTLAQAALRFALRWPWVVSASIPIPPPGRFEEILGYGRTPDITDSDLSRLFGRGSTPGARPTARARTDGVM